MQWEQDLEQAINDLDQQSTASSDAALMIGLDRFSGGGGDNNTMSGFSSESGHQADGSDSPREPSYPDIPQDDEEDRSELFQAYLKEMEGDANKKSEDVQKGLEEEEEVDEYRQHQQQYASLSSHAVAANMDSPQDHFEVAQLQEEHDDIIVDITRSQELEENQHVPQTTLSEDTENSKVELDVESKMDQQSFEFGQRHYYQVHESSEEASRMTGEANIQSETFTKSEFSGVESYSHMQSSTSSLTKEVQFLSEAMADEFKSETKTALSSSYAESGLFSDETSGIVMGSDLGYGLEERGQQKKEGEKLFKNGEDEDDDEDDEREELVGLTAENIGGEFVTRRITSNRIYDI